MEEQADLYAEVLAAFGEGRNVVIRTLDAGSDKPLVFATHAGEENPALGVRGLRLSFGNPGLLERQLDAVALAAERTGTVAVGDGADGGHRRRGRDVRRAGARPRPQGRGDGRGAERRAAGGPVPGAGGLPVDRHQRPDAVHDGRRPDGQRPGAPHRPLAAGRARPGGDHRRGRQAGRQAGRRLRRGGRRPAARGRAGRAWASRRCRWRSPRSGPSAPSSPRSRWTPARRPPRPRSPPATPQPRAPPSAASVTG